MSKEIARTPRKSASTSARKPAARKTAKASAEAAQPAHDARDAEAIRALVEREAYFIAERRGFAPGSEMQDWLEAERSVRARVAPAARV